MGLALRLVLPFADVLTLADARQRLQGALTALRRPLLGE